MAFTVPPLPYAFDALEPHIDAKTMEIHHDKHHNAYVTNLNKALEGHADLQSKSLEDLLKNLDSLPDGIRNAVRNNAGGHWNHSLFWTQMKKGGGGEPKGDLATAIKSAFGSFADFQAKFAAAGVGRFGSGWAWLLVKDGKLVIDSTPNQDTPISAERQGRAWRGRLGACLLPEVSEQAAGLHRGVVERRELGFRGRPLCSGEEVERGHRAAETERPDPNRSDRAFSFRNAFEARRDHAIS